MQSKSLPTPVVIAVIVLIIAAIGYFGYKAVGPKDVGGNYTPGVPPWKDPKVMNPGAGPTVPPPAKP